MEFLVRIWSVYPVVVDAMLYFFVFGAAARAGLAKSFPGHEGKALSVAIGLFLAVGLATAQRKLGFSLENIGPIAVLILCGLVLIASYKFLQHAELPKPAIILISGLLVLALLRVTMPRLTSRFLQENPFTVFLALAGLVYWAWHSSEKLAEKVQRRRPGEVLARHHVVPDRKALTNEARYIKKKVRRASKEDKKEEKAADTDLEKALGLLENNEFGGETRGKAIQLIDNARRSSMRVRQQCEKLARFDNALRRYDWAWLKKTHRVHLADLTAEQQELVRESFDEERKRLKVEEVLEKVELEVGLHVAAMNEYSDKAKSCLEDNNPAGATGWIAKAIEEDKKAEELESKILDWEKRLVKLVKRQLKELARSS